MRWLLLLFTACTSVSPTNLEGDITCGSMTCGSGQICYSRESGSLCDVNADAGIGPYQEYGWMCGTLPAGCDVTQECFMDRWIIVSPDGRHVDHLCI